MDALLQNSDDARLEADGSKQVCSGRQNVVIADSV